MLNQNIQRLLTLSILAIAAIFSLSNHTKAVELLTNGGFETALVGWTTSNTNGNTTWLNTWNAGIYTLDNQSTSSYSPPSFPQEGSRSLMFSLYNQGVPTNTMRLYQDMTVPSGTNLTISWKQRFSQNNATNPTTTGIITRVLIRNTSDTILQTVNLVTLQPQTNEVRPWETMSFALGSTYAGQTIRLEFNAIVTDSVGPNYTTTRGHWELDAVSANALAPTAAAVTLSGKVKDANGKPMSQVRMRIMDMDGDVQSVLTNKFGYYEFREIEAGQTYAMEAFQKGVRFINNPRIINVADQIDGEDFHADDPTTSR